MATCNHLSKITKQNTFSYQKVVENVESFCIFTSVFTSVSFDGPWGILLLFCEDRTAELFSLSFLSNHVYCLRKHVYCTTFTELYEDLRKYCTVVPCSTSSPMNFAKRRHFC